MWISLHPVLSCYLRLRYKMQYLFSSSDTVLWHSSVSHRKEPDLFSKHCAHSHSSAKNSYGCNICIQDLWFEGKKKKIYSVSCRVFWSEAWSSKTEIWTMRLLHGNMCLHQALARPGGGGFTPVVSLLHGEHSSPSSCIPPLPPPLPLSLKSKTKPLHSLPGLEETNVLTVVIAWSTFRLLALVFYPVCGRVCMCSCIR